MKACGTSGRGGGGTGLVDFLLKMVPADRESSEAIQVNPFSSGDGRPISKEFSRQTVQEASFWFP